MNVAEMLDRVRLHVHTDLTDKQIISRFNEFAQILFREIPLPEKLYFFETSDVPHYILPMDCTEDSIYNVVVEDIEYLKVDNSYQNPPPYHATILIGTLHIHPRPGPGKKAHLNYRPRPYPLREDRLEEEPYFLEDYHGLYIWDACSWIAGIQRDIDLKNNFAREYNELEFRAKKYLMKFGIKRVMESTIW